VLGVPVHPFKVGVIDIVAETGEAVLLTAVKLGTLLLPDAASPIEVFELVQVYVAPAGRLLKLDDETVAPEHTLKLPGTIATGSGLTVIIYEDEGPAHPFNTGVTVIVELILVLPEFRAVKAGTFPVPLAAKPIAVLEFVQVYVAPVGLLLKDVSAIEAPAHKVELPGTIAVGKGLIVITAAAEVADPQSLLTTTSYDPASVSSTVGMFKEARVAPLILIPFFLH